MIIISLAFPILIIAAVIAYFYNRKKKLDRMEIEDKIEDVFRNS